MSLYQIDLKNAQILLSVPLLLAGYGQLHGNDAKIPDDILLFKELAEEGCFYEYVAFKAGVDINTRLKREAFKEKFFIVIWYSKLRPWKSKLKDSFIDEFPNVWEVIKHLKNDDYRLFAVGLQKFEAQIFINDVLAELYKRNIPALSIHDSIVTNNIDDLYVAQSLLVEAMGGYGLNPSFKIDGAELLRLAS